MRRGFGLAHTRKLIDDKARLHDVMDNAPTDDLDGRVSFYAGAARKLIEGYEAQGSIERWTVYLREKGSGDSPGIRKRCGVRGIRLS
ncbi:MAG: hypothetical protein R3E31_06055 [Chloroflexota bacterium]